jgi:hypothetical protein
MTQHYTPAQLEALLEPYPARPTVMGNANASYTNSYSDSYVISAWEKKCDVIRKRRDAATPDLARLALEKDSEIARLKAQIQDIKECWDWWQEDTYDRCSSVVDDAIRQAIKETSDE